MFLHVGGIFFSLKCPLFIIDPTISLLEFGSFNDILSHLCSSSFQIRARFPGPSGMAHGTPTTWGTLHLTPPTSLSAVSPTLAPLHLNVSQRHATGTIWSKYNASILYIQRHL